MKILYLSSSSDWHIDLWAQYFAKKYSVYLFSDKENYLKDQPFEGVTVNHSVGLLGGIFNFFGMINTLYAIIRYAARIIRPC